ncbi:hypothetical protein E2C01_011662 [Portunus trituberculatus]|uniref:Uncharacterized protein n=1 Tax=Portunus trituberculatus TaxID=210409 RepID=A0A5B7DC12_PORTR|nr:hypothetical protein [Portunus trituberculatus]
MCVSSRQGRKASVWRDEVYEQDDDEELEERLPPTSSKDSHATPSYFSTAHATHTTELYKSNMLVWRGCLGGYFYIFQPKLLVYRWTAGGLLDGWLLLDAEHNSMKT